MAVQQISFAQPTIGRDIDFASMGQQLMQTYQNAQKRQILDRVAQGGGDPRELIQAGLQTGDIGFANLGANILQRQQEQQRQTAQDARQVQRDAVTDQQNAAYLDIARRGAARSDQAAERQNMTPEELAGERAKAARANGVDPASSAGRAYVLTGRLPEGDQNFAQVVTQRQQAAEANGLKPDHPGYQSFVLTGKMPREDAQPLTAGDKEAIRTADDAVVANKAAIDSLNRAKGLSKQAFSGPMADKRGYAASFLGEGSDWGKGGIATENLTNEVMTNALGQLKNIFGGNPTEGERKIMLEMQGSVSKPDSVRRDIYDRAIGLAQNRLEFNQRRADELRGNTYYKQRTGQQPANPSAPQAQAAARPQGADPLAQARDAIARGADRNAVIQRLQQHGVDPSGL